MFASDEANRPARFFVTAKQLFGTDPQSTFENGRRRLEDALDALKLANATAEQRYEEESETQSSTSSRARETAKVEFAA